MAKQTNNVQKNTNVKKNTKKATGVAKKKIVKKKRKLLKKATLEKIASKKHNLIMGIIITIIGLIMIVSTYAWLSTSLNVKINNFKMQVTKNSGLTISLDGINFDHSVEISYDTIIEQLKNTYPNNTSQWSANGLTPVSTNGISNINNDKFDVYASGGVRYKNRKKENGFISTYLADESERNAFNFFIAFDVFLKNVSGSPVADNLYLDYTTFLTTDTEIEGYQYDEEMVGLVNSARIGFVRIGSVPLNADVNTIQNVKCNNACQAIIYEPNSKLHTDMSIERANKYGINLQDGEPFPTYACINSGGPIQVDTTISGSTAIDQNYFALQHTITEADFPNPIFKVPDGITKVRIYIWIEGQDIDSLETDSEGTGISISIDMTKDTVGYHAFD